MQAAHYVLISEHSSNPTGPKNLEAILLSNLFVRGAAVYGTNTLEVIDDNDVTPLVVDKVHKKDVLSIGSDVNTPLQQLIRTVQRGNGPFRPLEAPFNAHLHRFKALGYTTGIRQGVFPDNRLERQQFPENLYSRRQRSHEG